MKSELTFVEDFIELLKGQSELIIARLQPTCLTVIFSLMIIDLTIDLLFDQGEDNIFMKLIRKILMYGAYITFILNYKTIVNEYALKGFIQLGNYISTGQTVTTFITSPSEILGKVLKYSLPVFSAHGFANTTLDFLGIESTPILSGLLVLALVGLALSVTCGMVMLFAKFYIVTSCAIILLPFAVFKETESIGKGVLQLFIKQGVNIMVMVLVLNMLGESMNFTGEITFMRLVMHIGRILIWFTLIREIGSLTNQIFGGYMGNNSKYGSGMTTFASKQIGQMMKNREENGADRGSYNSFRNGYKK